MENIISFVRQSASVLITVVIIAIGLGFYSLGQDIVGKSEKETISIKQRIDQKQYDTINDTEFTGSQVLNFIMENSEITSIVVITKDNSRCYVAKYGNLAATNKVTANINDYNYIAANRTFKIVKAQIGAGTYNISNNTFIVNPDGTLGSTIGPNEIHTMLKLMATTEAVLYYNDGNTVSNILFIQENI